KKRNHTIARTVCYHNQSNLSNQRLGTGVEQLDQQLAMPNQIGQQNMLVRRTDRAIGAGTADRGSRDAERLGEEEQRLGKWPLRQQRQRRGVQLLTDIPDPLDERV